MKKILIALILSIPFNSSLIAQLLKNKNTFTHQDTLRGSINTERDWWDVLRYDISITPNYVSKKITGKVIITYKVIKDRKNVMQIDLQEPMKIVRIDRIGYLNRRYTREGNAYHIKVSNASVGSVQKITIKFEGFPKIAVTPPWDGGWIFTKDEKNRPWITVACQGLGASVWYPCKDHQSDEPDNGASLSITVPDTLVAVANGRLIEKKRERNQKETWKWEVKNPINNYNIVPYIGKYVTWTETYSGEKGNLDCNYWVLDYNLKKAKEQFIQVQSMLKCFEHWFGPYPFYEDSYKLIESSHLGMEHQSAVAYGNKYMNGYLGMDISGTGWGKNWDYIIVHESGHEWFANNITTNDIADMWIHEGFTCYSETLYTECLYGKEAGNAYTQGLRKGIENKAPIIGSYGVNEEGGSDMYSKGSNMLHTIRQVINNDSLFRQILKELNKFFYHKVVTSKEIEIYFSNKSGKDLSTIFDQYLREVKIPVLEYKIEGPTLSYRWINCISGFNMPIKVYIGNIEKNITPSKEWQTQNIGDGGLFSIDNNYYVESKKMN